MNLGGCEPVRSPARPTATQTVWLRSQYGEAGTVVSGLIAHEWIARTGGSEQVVKAMAQEFDTAEIFCLWNDDPQFLADRTVTESILARTALRRSKAAALPFMPFVWSSRSLEKYDWVLASSHLYAHQIGAAAARRGTPVFVYTHTPARYLWEPTLDGRAGTGLARVVSPLLRVQDRRAAQKQSHLAVNSKFVQRRVQNAWRRPSRVIYPPVDTETLQSVTDWSEKLGSLESATIDQLPDHFVLGASRFVPYKKLDQVIDFGEKCDVPVVLAGSGPEERRLRQKAAEARVPVHFVNRPSNELLFALYQRALAYVFPPVEDFGIMPVEAMALGTPVIVNPVGGASESAELLRGGIPLPDSQSAWRQALNSALSLDMTNARLAATTLSVSSYRKTIREWVESES